MLKEKKIQPILLSGGSGTRLWPLSREDFPKQYIKLSSSSAFSFLQKTQQRLEGLKNVEDPIIICNEQHRFIVAEQMRQIQVNPKSIILEPCSKNTAPAVAIAALLSFKEKKDITLLILSSDHEIKDPISFKNTIERGLADTEEDKLVTFGVIPTRPETGYGYIEAEANFRTSNLKSVPIKRFIEKPDLEKAKTLFNNENYLWNSGIFLFKAKSMIDELNKYEPELLKFCELSLENSKKDLDFLRINKDFFSSCPNISIDKAVMEKTQKASVCKLDAGWSDVGNWGAIWDIEEKDKNGNTIIGDIYTSKVKNSYLYSKNKLLVGVGINDLIVVQTEDATLIANINQPQEIKGIVNKLNSQGRSEVKIHTKVFRPWGYFKLIGKGSNWQVKQIFVNPKSSLSLQKHNHRSEHWIVLKGIANIQIETKELIISENQSTFIPIGTKHRLSNLENHPLTIIEVQSGKYLGEDDIIRYDDNYGRLN